MLKNLKRIAEGNFTADRGSLQFSCAEIVITVEKGGVYEGSFRIYSDVAALCQGQIVSSHVRMECVTAQFAGSEEEVFFRFDGNGLEVGSVVKGEFVILSTQGEYVLPYEVTIKAPALVSSQGIIGDLGTYVNLAKKQWREAVRLFYLPEFAELLKEEKELAESYALLSVYPGNEQNVEEFLICADKKSCTEYLLEQTSLQIELPLQEDGEEYISKQQISILRNGWGYTHLEIDCRGDFLYTEKEVLNDDDFLGTSCNLPVYIDSSRCRIGKNFGRIVLRNSYMELEIPVLVKCGYQDRQMVYDRSKKRLTVELMEYYQAYRMRKITKDMWLAETKNIVDRMMATNEKDINARLFQAHLLLTEGNTGEAGWILDYVAELMPSDPAYNDTLYAYYLYLTTLIHSDLEYVIQVTAEIEHIYRQDVSNWRVAWLLLFLSEEYNKSASGKWVFLEKQFLAGTTSPVLYIDALNILNHNPTILRKLDRFELQVLYYGMKKEYLSQDVVDQMLYLTERTREYSQILFRLLSMLYQKERSVVILREICSLLIKGNKVGAEYFPWYKMGVEQNLRITNLYEYYVMSLDMNKEQALPKILLLYFSYQTNLDYTREAYLYNYVLRHRYEMEDVYEAYREKIKNFAIQQIQMGRVNRHLANIYHQVLKQEMLNEENCFMVSRILFAYQIRVEDERLRKVYVYHRGNLHPQEYQLVDGTTWIALYDVTDKIVLEDGSRNRFLQSIPYTKKSLTRDEKYLSWLLPFDCENLQLDLYIAGRSAKLQEPAEYNEARILRIAKDDWAGTGVKINAYLTLLQQYIHTGQYEKVKDILWSIPLDKMTYGERNKVAACALQSGNAQWVANGFLTYGADFADNKWLTEDVWNAFPEEYIQEEHGELLCMAYGAYRKGNRFESIIKYLITYLWDTTARMCELWEKTKELSLQTRTLEEKILTQALFTGTKNGKMQKIMQSYFAMEPKPLLRDALVNMRCFELLCLGREVEGPIFDEIRTLFYQGEKIPNIQKLAFLKYCKSNDGYRKLVEEDGVIEKFLSEVLTEGIYLEFLKAYAAYPFVKGAFADKAVVEFTGNPGENRSIRFTLKEQRGEPLWSGEETMKVACPGVYYQEFVLFYGETLEYVILGEEGQEQSTGTVTKMDGSGEGCAVKYAFLNQMSRNMRMGEYQKVQNMLLNYHKKEYVAEGIFKLQ